MIKKSRLQLRWERAQVYEKNFWRKQRSNSARSNTPFKWYEERAQQVFSQAQPFLDGFSNISALEIGPGPIGLINYLRFEERYALDPLENFYGAQPEVIKARDKHVHYSQGTGEDISSLHKTFSFIIMDNVLDHVKDPHRVLKELYKNLGPGGVVFISLNIYKPFGVFIRNMMELVQLDKGHPYSFSQSSFCSIIEKNGFEIMSYEIGDYRRQKKRYKKSGKPKEILKACLGISDFRFSAFCKKI
jgi:SAM-dependent methyltransferase